MSLSDTTKSQLSSIEEFKEYGLSFEDYEKTLDQYCVSIKYYIKDIRMIFNSFNPCKPFSSTVRIFMRSKALNLTGEEISYLIQLLFIEKPLLNTNLREVKYIFRYLSVALMYRLKFHETLKTYRYAIYLQDNHDKKELIKKMAYEEKDVLRQMMMKDIILTFVSNGGYIYRLRFGYCKKQTDEIKKEELSKFKKINL